MHPHTPHPHNIIAQKGREHPHMGSDLTLGAAEQGTGESVWREMALGSILGPLLAPLMGLGPTNQPSYWD
jgi:hypothetical protein